MLIYCQCIQTYARTYVRMFVAYIHNVILIHCTYVHMYICLIQKIRAYIHINFYSQRQELTGLIKPLREIEKRIELAESCDDEEKRLEELRLELKWACLGEINTVSGCVLEKWTVSKWVSWKDRQ